MTSSCTGAAIRLRPRREGADRRVRGLPEPARLGQGNVHVLGDRGTDRMELGDVKRSTPEWSS